MQNKTRNSKKSKKNIIPTTKKLKSIKIRMKISFFHFFRKNPLFQNNQIDSKIKEKSKKKKDLNI